MTPLIEVIIIYYSDEEIGGVLGMRKFIEHSCFKDMNVGFGLDEGDCGIFSTFISMFLNIEHDFS